MEFTYFCIEGKNRKYELSIQKLARLASLTLSTVVRHNLVYNKEKEGLSDRGKPSFLFE